MIGCACFDWQVSLETRASLVSPERRDSPDQRVSVETPASQEPQVQPLPPSLWQSKPFHAKQMKHLVLRIKGVSNNKVWYKAEVTRQDNSRRCLVWQVLLALLESVGLLVLPDSPAPLDSPVLLEIQASLV
jgi:hypothetical protein